LKRLQEPARLFGRELHAFHLPFDGGNYGVNVCFRQLAFGARTSGRNRDYEKLLRNGCSDPAPAAPQAAGTRHPNRITMVSESPPTRLNEKTVVSFTAIGEAVTGGPPAPLHYPKKSSTSSAPAFPTSLS
jgi:hypothetical protein